MTTSEHADLIAEASLRVDGMSPEHPTAVIVRRLIAALASTPSPAQPTEQHTKVTESILAPECNDGECEHGEHEEDCELVEVEVCSSCRKYFDDDEEVLLTPWAVAEANGHIMPEQPRPAASPVQGADDRLAQEVIAAALLVGGEDAKTVLDEVWRILEAYQQSPQAALNEVRAGALEDARPRFDAHDWTQYMMFTPGHLLAVLAAELRAAPQTGDVEA